MGLRLIFYVPGWSKVAKDSEGRQSHDSGLGYAREGVGVVRVTFCVCLFAVFGCWGWIGSLFGSDWLRFWVGGLIFGKIFCCGGSFC